MSAMEEIQARHRQEQRQLQSRITQKKKNATKKTRKGINAECEELERQLKQKQDDEIAQLTGTTLTEAEKNKEGDINGELEPPDMPRSVSVNKTTAAVDSVQKSDTVQSTVQSTSQSNQTTR